MRPIDPTPLRKQIVAFPSPNVADRIFHERRDSQQASYAVPVFGTPHPNVVKYPGFLLAYVKASDDVGWADWYYVNDRLNQDAYNYEIQYPYASTDYPRYIRTYVYLQTTLVEPAAGSADPVFAGFSLVDHKHSNIGDPVLDTLFVSVQRAYERIPGPILTTRDYPTTVKGALATTTRQTVAPGTAVPVPGTTYSGGIVIESEVVDATTVLANQEITTISAWPILYDWLWDPDLVSWIRIKFEIVPKVDDDPIPTAPSAGTMIDYKAIDEAWTTKITYSVVSAINTLGSTQKSQIEYDFPAVLIGAVGIGALHRLDNQESFYLNPNLLSARRVITNALVVTSYYTTYALALAAAPAPTDLRPNTFRYSGQFLDLSLGACLCDAQTINANTSSNNPVWGVVSEGLVIGASSPNATTYVSWMNNPAANLIILPYKIKQAKYNLWQLEVWKVEPR